MLGLEFWEKRGEEKVRKDGVDKVKVETAGWISFLQYFLT